MNNQEHALTLREADTLARRGDLSAAANLIEKLLVAVPDHSQALTMLGRIYRANNQSEKAVSILRKLCRVDGQDFWSWFELGEAFE
ncbi:MAG: tetratricopeptide repeat protein, partial [Acidimicrobiales bacterium]